MRRRYLTHTVEEAVAYLRKKIPQVMFTADVIVGFPGETKEEFHRTYDFLSRLRLAGMHIFPYSKRPGTPAATMQDQIPDEVKSQRLHALSSLRDQMRADLIAAEYGKSVPVLFEQYKDGYAYGHTPNFLEVKVAAREDLSNRIGTVRLKRLEGEFVLGCLEEKEANH
jgi:threonylcarbamoyladenosine tRNA methylthiotransferase MtaB